MPNTPAGTRRNIAIGNAIVLLGATGLTPTEDVGFLSEDGVAITYETETVDVPVGFPAVSVRQFVSAVTSALAFTTIEWDLETFAQALVGVLSTSATLETLAVGVDPCPSELTAQVQFCMPCVGDTIEIDLWKIQSDGNFGINFDNAAAHQFPYNFRVLLADEKWDGTPLTADVGLFEIRRFIAP